MGRILLVLALLGVLAGPLVAEETLQVAVLRLQPRENGAEAHAWLGPALGQLLAGALGRRDGVVAVERERVADLIRERDLRAHGLIATDEAGRLARIADADWGVVGSYSVAGEVVDLDLTVVEAATGKALRSARLEGRTDDLGRLVARMVQAVFGAKGLEPAVSIPPVPVEAFKAYARALAADERGDYPLVFVELSRALREDPSFSLAELELGRLYHRMGEPEHAIVTLRHVVDTAVDAEHVVAAALAGADVLKRDLDDLDGASRLLERVVDRYPYYADVHTYAGRVAAYRANGGDVVGAFAFLERIVERLTARQQRIFPDGFVHPVGRQARARNARPVARYHELRAAVMRLTNFRHSLAMRYADALPLGVPLPDHWYRLRRDDPTIHLDGKALTPYAASLQPGGDFTILAWPDTRIAALDLVFHLTPATEGEIGRMNWYAYGPGCRTAYSQNTLEVSDPTAPIVRRVDLPVPAPRISLHVWGQNVKLDAIEIRATVVKDGPEPRPWPSRPPGCVPFGVGLPGSIQHARFTEEEGGRLHVVFAAGPIAVAMPSHGAFADAFDEADLWVATREPGADAFLPPRRLQVSSLDGEYHPALLRGRDGRYRLVWVMTRNGEAYGGLWYAESDDLETWTWPRRVPIPNVENPQVGPGAGTVGLGGAHAVAYPQLVEREAGVIEVFVTAWHGPEGAGVYRLTTTDGVAWSPPARVADRTAIGSLAPLSDGALLLAAWTEGNELAWKRIGKDGRVEAVESHRLPSLPTRMGWYRPLLAADPDGSLHLWIPLEPGAWARFVSTDGRTWRGPVDRVEGFRPTDVHVDAGHRVLTMLGDCHTLFLHEGEEAK